MYYLLCKVGKKREKIVLFCLVNPPHQKKKKEVIFFKKRDKEVQLLQVNERETIIIMVRIPKKNPLVCPGKKNTKN